MRKILFFCCLVLLFLPQISRAQEAFFQTGHTHDILEVHFSPDDSQLASYSAGDGNLILWDVKSGRQLWTTKTTFIRKGDESINLIEFYWSRDGKFLVTKSLNGTYQTWDAVAGKIVALTGQKPEIELIAPDKKPLSYTKDYEHISVRDAETGEIIKIKRFGNDSALNTSNDATMIAEGGGWGDAAIRITEIKTGKSWWLDGHPSVVGGIAFSPDGKFFAVGGSDRIIYIFEAATRRLTRKFTGNTKPINYLAFSPDGKTLFSSEKYGVLRAWSWQDGTILHEIKPERSSFAGEKFSFSPDGKYLLTRGNEIEISLRDAKSFNLVRSFKTAEAYEYTAGRLNVRYNGVPVSSANFSRDGRRIISAHADDGTVRIWNADDGSQIKKLKVCENASFAAFSGSNEKKILAYCEKEDKAQIKIFDAATGGEIFKFTGADTSYIKNISLNSAGSYFATSDIVGDVLLWDVNRSKLVRELDIGFSGDDAIAFSPDGKTFLVGGKNQNLFMFDGETGEKLWQLIASYQPGELEKKLEEEKAARQAVLSEAGMRRDEQAAIETEKYEKQIYITFSHYGDMSDPGGKRMLESSEPKESKIKKSRAAASAVWLRLHNDSPLPVKIPTRSMYAPNANCFFEFPGALKISGLCDKREISVWHGLKDKNDRRIPYGFDFGSSAVLLPKTTVLFPVPLEILKNGSRIVFEFTFQNETGDKEIDDYGTAKELKFGEADLPKEK